MVNISQAITYNNNKILENHPKIQYQQFFFLENSDRIQQTFSKNPKNMKKTQNQFKLSYIGENSNGFSGKLCGS